MVSYEKVRRSLRTATITIIVLNSLSLVFRLFTGISVQLAKTEINKGNTGNLPKEHIEAVLSATTPFMLFVTALIVLVNIAIVIFCIKNLRAIKRNQMVNYLPYYLGFAITVGLVILGFLTTKARTMGNSYKYRLPSYFRSSLFPCLSKSTKTQRT